MSQLERYCYDEEHIISSGSVGQVFRAYDLLLNRFVALKIIPKLERVQNAQQLLNQEVEALKKVTASMGQEYNFQQLITYYDFFTTETTNNIVMELFEDSENLQNYIQNNGGKIPTQMAIEIFYQICKGIQVLHSLNIVHRDIKPANILIKLNPLRIKVIDFGYAKLLSDIFQQFQSIAGSPVFMSPQNIMGTGYDGKANDIWTLGIMLYQMTTGLFPWMSSSPQQLNLEMGQYLLGQNQLKLFHLQFDTKDLILDCLQSQESDRFNIEQLLQKVQMKLSRNSKTFDSSFKPLPICDWLEIHSHRPKIVYQFLDFNHLVRAIENQQ